VADLNTSIIFKSMSSAKVLSDNCKLPQIVVSTESFRESSDFSLFRGISKRWFAWNLLVDEVPVTTPFPYLRTNDSSLDELSDEVNAQLDDNLLRNQEKHVFHTWRHNDAIFECSNRFNSSDDASKSTIIWKTQFGYLSYLDKDLMEAIKGEQFDDEWDETKSSLPNYNSFKIFYKMNKLTKIYKNLTVKIGRKFA
jgi:hypothetical protein